MRECCFHVVCLGSVELLDNLERILSVSAAFGSIKSDKDWQFYDKMAFMVVKTDKKRDLDRIKVTLCDRPPKRSVHSMHQQNHFNQSIKSYKSNAFKGTYVNRLMWQ